MVLRIVYVEQSYSGAARYETAVLPTRDDDEISRLRSSQQPHLSLTLLSQHRFMRMNFTLGSGEGVHTALVPEATMPPNTKQALWQLGVGVGEGG